MEPAESSSPPERVRGVERSFQVQVGGLGGFELRPTRFFVWGGAERGGAERILPLGARPRNLLVPRRPRELHAGAVHVRTLGNPLLTVALAGVYAVRRVRKTRSNI
jgi:hypothetical protein